MRISLLFVSIISLIAAAPSMAATTNASSAVLHVYKAYLAQNADCSSPILLVDNGATSQTLDMVTNPTIGQGSVPSKAYKCLILEMSDKIDFIPSGTTGNCTAGQSYTRYVCQSGTSTKNPLTGESVPCTGTSQNGEDRVWVYISRWSTANADNNNNYNAFTSPVSEGDSNNGVSLATDIDASNGGGAFVFSLTGKIDGGQNPCDLKPPTISFRSN